MYCRKEEQSFRNVAAVGDTLKNFQFIKDDLMIYECH